MLESKFSSEPVKQSDIDAIRGRIGTGFEQLAGLISNVRKPIPQTGNGTDLNPQDDSETVFKKLEGAISDMRHLGITNVPTMLEVLGKAQSGDPWNDKDYLMERLIQVAAGFPDDSKAGKKITDGFLTTLYNDLQHPPQSILGKDYTYRSADGSHNSLLYPDLGKAGMPYARTVAPKTMQPGALPEPELIFDSLMVRKHNDKHPNKISSMLFYLASIIIHDIFRTNHTDFTISDTSSYLDLSPLYGSNQAEQNRIRTSIFDGKLIPDCFSETRLLMFPPGVGCIIIMFNRFHNYVVDQIVAVNERDQFTKPAGDMPKNMDKPKSDPKSQDEKDQAEWATYNKWKNYDENLFQTARLVTCGLYINIILVDYVRTILNLNKTNSNWSLDPRADIKGTPVAAGNQVSGEFNLVYRWHSTISDRDEKWTEELYKELFPGTDPAKLGWHDFIKRASKIQNDIEKKSPPDREFAGLKRDTEGRFDDDKLVEILVSSIEDCGNAYGANRVPKVMRMVEALGIKQARAWNLASLNEFRKYFNLTPHKTFESINSDPYVASQLKYLYDTPDQVELYVGLVTEEPKKPMVPGAGLTPSYTTSRAVLSDAVALVRGDRFYTIDYHPKKLTNWGFTEVASDKSIANGCVFYKLFLRAFPNHFKPNSVYVHYPMTIPSEMKSVLTTLGRADKYDFVRPKRIPEPTVIFTYEAAKKIVLDKETFRVTWGEAMEFLMGAPAKNFMLAGDGPKNAESRKMMEAALYVEGKWDKEVREYYETITAKLLKKKSYKLGDINQVDIIRDVGNLAHVHFAAEVFSLPLKTEERPLGIFTEHELYLIMAAVFICVFFDLDPAESFELRQKAHKATQVLGQLVEANVTEIKAGGLFNKLWSAIFPEPSPLADYGIHMIKRLLQNGMPVKDLVWGHIMGTAGGMTANQGQLFAQTLEYFLTTGKEHLPAINKLAKESGDASFDKLMHYFLEGSRLNGETGVFRYVSKAVTIKDGPKTYNFQPGDKIMVNFRSASKDPNAFPDPETVKLDRPIDSYIHLGMGPHQCLGWRMTRVALTAMLKVIGRLDNLRVPMTSMGVPAPQGVLKKVLRPFSGEADKVPDEWKYHAFLTENHDQFWPFPQNLKINWD